MKRTLLAASLTAACLIGTAQAEPVNLKPGQWTYTMNMEVPGTGMPPISETESDCMEEWEAKLEPSALAQEFAGGADCKATDVQQSTGKVSFTMSCPGEAMDGAKISLTHSYDSFTMDGDLSIPNGQGGFLAADLTVTAQNVGTCTS